MDLTKLFRVSDGGSFIFTKNRGKVLGDAYKGRGSQQQFLEDINKQLDTNATLEMRGKMAHIHGIKLISDDEDSSLWGTVMKRINAFHETMMDRYFIKGNQGYGAEHVRWRKTFMYLYILVLIADDNHAEDRGLLSDIRLEALRNDPDTQTVRQFILDEWQGTAERTGKVGDQNIADALYPEPNMTDVPRGFNKLGNRWLEIQNVVRYHIHNNNMELRI